MPGMHTLQFGPFRVDLTYEQVWHGAAERRLRPQSFAVLRQLLTHAGQLLTKEALWHAVWPEVAVGDKALAVCIGELRKALGDDPQAPRFIATVHRRGYRFIAPVTAVDASETTPATSSPHPPLAPARPPLLVGREAELRQLHGWFAQARRGVRQIVFVTGDAGIGKTTVVEAFQAQADAILSLAHAQGFPVLAGYGTCWQGWALAMQGQGEAALAQLQQGVDAVLATGQTLARPFGLLLHAEAVGHAGQGEAGLLLLAEALAACKDSGRSDVLAEVYRLRGELCLGAGGRGAGVGSPPAVEAAACLHQAMEIARRQQAKSWELRAALSLARLWQRQRKRAAARQVLAEIYGWFTEGFDTADLVEAGALLHELGSYGVPHMPRQFGAGECVVFPSDSVARTAYTLPPSCTRVSACLPGLNFLCWQHYSCGGSAAERQLRAIVHAAADATL